MEHENRMAQLTPYERARKPQQIPATDKVVQITGRFLESELSCAICLGLLKNTRTTKECLHRFCSECISQALRSGNKECPNCRKKLASMRSLRPDPVFDEIIKVIFPNREEMEQHESQLLQMISNNGKAFVSSVQQGKRAQAEQRGRSVRRRRMTAEEADMDEAGPSTSTSEAGSVLGGRRGTSEATDGSADEPDSKIFLQIIPNETQINIGATKLYAKKWKRRVVKVKSTVTVGHISAFILHRLLWSDSSSPSSSSSDLPDISKVRIDIRLTDGESVSLDSGSTLAQIADLYPTSISTPLYLAFTITGKLKFP